MITWQRTKDVLLFLMGAVMIFYEVLSDTPRALIIGVGLALIGIPIAGLIRNGRNNVHRD